MRLARLDLGYQNTFTHAGLEVLLTLPLKHLKLGMHNTLPENTVETIRGLSLLDSLDLHIRKGVHRLASFCTAGHAVNKSQPWCIW